MWSQAGLSSRPLSSQPHFPRPFYSQGEKRTRRSTEAKLLLKGHLLYREASWTSLPKPWLQLLSKDTAGPQTSPRAYQTWGRGCKTERSVENFVFNLSLSPGHFPKWCHRAGQNVSAAGKFAGKSFRSSGMTPSSLFVCALKQKSKCRSISNVSQVTFFFFFFFHFRELFRELVFEGFFLC